jgi:hypothetical protein
VHESWGKYVSALFNFPNLEHVLLYRFAISTKTIVMKKFFLFIALIICEQFFCFCYAQSQLQQQAQTTNLSPNNSNKKCNSCKNRQTYIVEYNCSTDQFSNPVKKYLPEGTPVAVKYTHVNPFAVNSNLQGVSVSANFNDGFEALQKIINALGSAQAQTSTDQNKVNDSATKLDAVPAIENTFAFIKPESKAAKKNEKKLDTLSKINDLLAKKSDEVGAIILEKNTLNKNIGDLDNVLLTADAIDSALKDVTITNKNDLISRIQSNSLINVTSSNDIKTGFSSALTATSNSIEKIQDHINTLQNINDQIKLLKSDYAFDKLIDSLSAATQKLSNTYSAANTQPLKKQLIGIIDLYQKAAISDFAIRSNKVYFINDDELDLHDSLLLSDKTLYKSVGPIKFTSYCGTRIDFSLGIATTLGNLNATSYYIIRDTTSGSGKAIGISSSRKNSIGNFSPVAFFHFTIKCASAISPTLSVGLNPDFSTIGNSRLLIGGSIAFTQTNSILQRFVFTGGIGAGLTDVLLTKYNNIKTNNDLAHPDPNADALLTSLTDSQLTEKALRFGGFFSVSFNLTQLKGK